jgi:Uma2 family endonuclease
MEQLIPVPTRRVTEMEYLSMEELAQSKHEYRNGEVVGMACGTFIHGRIAANLLRRLGERLEGSPCQAVGSDVRVHLRTTRSYFYPDATVVCGSPIYEPPDRQLAISNPRMIVEVTTPSREADDRGEKFDDYRRIESLREYILVS